MLPLQRYISPDLTHLVGRKLRNHEKQFRLLTKIIRTRVLKARSDLKTSNGRAYILNKHYGRQLSSNDAYEGSYICFCDIPLGDLSIHMAKYSKFGLAFSKNYLAEKGAVPVMYVPERGRPSLLPFKRYWRHRVSSQSVSFDEFWKCFNRLDSSTTQAFLRRIQPETAKDLEKVIGFLDFNILSHLKFFNHKLDDVARRNFYMEREWRVGRDVRFSLASVKRIVIPKRFGKRLRKALPQYNGEVVFAD